MYLRLAADGHEVRVFVEAAEQGVMEGMIARVADWRAELDWIREAGSEGLVVFETAEHGDAQDELRRDGFTVIGGSALGDRLEGDRMFGQAMLAAHGMRTIATRRFYDCDGAIAFIRAHPARYVFKLDGSGWASWRNYVGQAEDGADVIALLQGLRARMAAIGERHVSFVLMDHVLGVEVGVGAYFNGERFLQPACLDWEHKRFFPGDIGELTGEMGTVVTYEGADRLFMLTLAKLAAPLRDSGYVGYINLNTIVDARGVWPLELTCRFGVPGFAILDALQRDGWAPLLRVMGDRHSTHFAAKPGFAVGVVLTVPPFPYAYGYAEMSKGLPISFAFDLSAAERERLHLAEVALHDGKLVASGSTGALMVVTGTGASVHAAQAEAYALAQKVFVPNLRYRQDIGDTVASQGLAALQRWGYLDAPV